MIAPLVLLLLVLTIWDVVWKAIALWKSARHKQLVWFIFLLIINSVSILPIIYLLFFQKKRKIKRIKKK